ncbi:N-acetylglucosamine kinase [Aeoliella sp. SH292]|uniref:N-acetylglucosamine kinase n=1 Tax=Aeoliella sp. SH292 TaxID=3454464 RepID=UPI003F9C2C19
MQSFSSDSELYLVVDGGGTKTDCQLLECKGGNFVVRGEGHSTASNPGAIGVEAATAAILAAVDLARGDAKVDEGTAITRAALAIAGTVDTTWRSKLEQSLQIHCIATECRVFPDVLPPVLAASLSGPAGAIIAGTGSAAIVRDANGDYGVSGGWGYLLGDEGSGYGIGREALRAALDELERGTQRTPFATRVLQHFEANSSVELKQAIYRHPQPKTAIAELTPAVLELAANHDAAASMLVGNAVDELHATLLRAIERLDLAETRIPLAIAGGMFRPSSPLRDRVREKLLGTGSFTGVQFVDSPLVAARLLLADQVFHAPIQFVS